MLVKDIMSSSITVIGPDQPVSHAIEIMRTENVGIVPVCDSQRHLLGVITDRDIIIRGGITCDYVAKDESRSLMKEKKASDIMSKDLITVTSGDQIHDAALKFSQNGVRRLPVVDNGKLSGILSLKDLAKKKVLTAEIGHIIYSVCNCDKEK